MDIKKIIGFLILIELSAAERLHGQIYSSIEGGAACFRRLNGTHQAGCSSSNKGAIGVVQMIKEVSDAQWMVANGTAGPYMAVVNTALFHDVVELLMRNPHNVAGVLLYDSATSKASAFSQDSRCPNEHSSDSGSKCTSTQEGGTVWNPPGTGLLQRDIPFPIFFLPDSRAEEIEKVEACYERYNLDKENQEGMPLCSIQLNTFMFAAVNSIVCMRRSATSGLLSTTKVCDPLGDHNVYYSLFPRASETEKTKKSVTLVTARIDAASLFDGLAPGAASSVIGMVTLITAAATLAKMIPDTDANLYNKNILWTLLNGESFDYIGSQRIAYDISRNAWPSVSPLSASDIKLHLEIGQLGGSFLTYSTNTSWPLYAFAPYSTGIDGATLPAQVTEFLEELQINLNQKNMSVTPRFDTSLPPSSLHSFRRILRNATESRELAEVLIADHDDTFTNMYYNSVLDEDDKIGFIYHNISIDNEGTFISTDALLANGTIKPSELQVKISLLATALSRTLYQQVTGKPYEGTETTSAHLVDEMLYCLLRSQACRLLLAADYAHSGSSEMPPTRPAPLYVGVAAWAGVAPVCAGHLLALLAGTHLSLDRAACDNQQNKDYSYYWLRGWNHTGVCIQTTMNFSQAVSPAFITPDYDFTSGMYSTWTESVWQAMWARVFVSAAGTGAKMAAVAGAVATLFVAALTFWLHRHASVVFMHSPPTMLDESASGILRTVNC